MGWMPGHHDTESAQVVHITCSMGVIEKAPHSGGCDILCPGRSWVVEIAKGKRCRGGHLIESPAKIPHRWLNESNRVTRILVVKTPGHARPHCFESTWDTGKGIIGSSLFGGVRAKVTGIRHFFMILCALCDSEFYYFFTAIPRACIGDKGIRSN